MNPYATRAYANDLKAANTDMVAALSQAIRFFHDNGGDEAYSFLPSMRQALIVGIGTRYDRHCGKLIAGDLPALIADIQQLQDDHADWWHLRDRA